MQKRAEEHESPVVIARALDVLSLILTHVKEVELKITPIFTDYIFPVVEQLSKEGSDNKKSKSRNDSRKRDSDLVIRLHAAKNLSIMANTAKKLINAAIKRETEKMDNTNEDKAEREKMEEMMSKTHR
eukprot:UN05910